jgi:flagellin
MALYLQTNVASLNAQANLAGTQNALQSNFARLASGYRINSAADDAAGLGISDQMTAKIRYFHGPNRGRCRGADHGNAPTYA